MPLYIEYQPCFLKLPRRIFLFGLFPGRQFYLLVLFRLALFRLYLKPFAHIFVFYLLRVLVPPLFQDSHFKKSLPYKLFPLHCKLLLLPGRFLLIWGLLFYLHLQELSLIGLDQVDLL